MPTRPKGIESAAHERSVVVHIRTDGHSVAGRTWTTKVVRGARMRERGASLLTSAAHHSGGLFGQALPMPVIRAAMQLLNITTCCITRAY